jgi:hypothetical protein
MGKRVNTKEQRAKDKLNRERGELIRKAILCNPGFRVRIPQFFIVLV